MKAGRLMFLRHESHSLKYDFANKEFKLLNASGSLTEKYGFKNSHFTGKDVSPYLRAPLILTKPSPPSRFFRLNIGGLPQYDVFKSSPDHAEKIMALFRNQEFHSGYYFIEPEFTGYILLLEAQSAKAAAVEVNGAVVCKETVKQIDAKVLYRIFFGSSNKNEHFTQDSVVWHVDTGSF